MAHKIFGFLIFLLFQVQIQNPDIEKAKRFFNDGNYVKAEKFLLGFLNDSPCNPEARELLGDARAHQKNWNGAIPVYKELMEGQEENADYHFKYAGALAMKVLERPKIQGVFFVAEIKEHFLKAARLDPNHVEVRWALLELHLRLPPFLGGGKGPAQEYALELERISPVDGHLARGHLFENLGNFREAETHYQRAVETGGSLHCFGKLSDLYLHKLRNPMKAIRTMEEALSRHGENSLRLQIGRIAAAHRLIPDKARSHLENYLLELSPAEENTAKEAVALLATLGTQEEQ